MSEVLNVITAVWLAHWASSFTRYDKDENGVGKAMFFLLSSLSLDKFRESLFDKSVTRGVTLALVLISLGYLYYEVNSDVKTESKIGS